eukprot:11185052-Lingulodinium_polyedra.AAC.1
MPHNATQCRASPRHVAQYCAKEGQLCNARLCNARQRCAMPRSAMLRSRWLKNQGHAFGPAGLAPRR